MNILPKKRWHVRTKENIARVRKDEAEAAAKEKEERFRIENADREARLTILKQKSKQRLQESCFEEYPQSIPSETTKSSTTSHINLFEDLGHATTTTNKEHDKEVKEQAEQYEKKIGYLTYLGQDTNEALKKKNWYEVLPESSRFSRSAEIKDTYEKLVLRDEHGKAKTKEVDVKDGEVSWKAKQLADPMNAFKKYCYPKIETKKTEAKEPIEISTHKHKKSKKKHKKCKDDKEKKLQKLREARLKRERAEKLKTELFLTGLNGASTSNMKKDEPNKIKPKYNSQFNPELARQNFK